MELLLNLAWLLLALPAYWLWRSSRSVRAGRHLRSVDCLLALGCMLVVLFPVVSATDDLHAMRAEMEESPNSKRAVVCQKANDRPSAFKWHSLPALVSNPFPFSVGDGRSLIIKSHPSKPSVAPSIRLAGRDPPDLLLS